MNGPEHFGGNMPDIEKEIAARKRAQELAARDAAVARFKQRPKVAQGEIDRAIELAKHGIETIPARTHPVIAARTIFRPKFATINGVRVPSTPPKKSYTEVDQPELVRGPDGNWVRKDEQ